MAHHKTTTAQSPEPHVEKLPPNRRMQIAIGLGILSWTLYLAALFLAGVTMGQGG